MSLHLTLYSQITFTELYLRLLQLSHTQYKLKCYPLTSGDNCWIIKVLVFKCQIIPSAWEWNWEFLMIGDSMTTDTIEVSDGVIVRLKGTPVHNLEIQQCIFILHFTVYYIQLYSILYITGYQWLLRCYWSLFCLFAQIGRAHV